MSEMVFLPGEGLTLVPAFSPASNTLVPELTPPPRARIGIPGGGPPAPGGGPIAPGGGPGGGIGGPGGGPIAPGGGSIGGAGGGVCAPLVMTLTTVVAFLPTLPPDARR